MSQTKAQLLDNIKDNVQLDARNSLRFADTDSSHYVAFKAPATVSSNVTWTLPAADGSANYVLATDGSGTLSWIADPAGQWTTSGSNIYFTGGNVGIGDSSPSNPLSVTGASSFNGDITFTGASYNVTWDKSADDLIFNDNAKAAFGTSSDLTIYHNGTHSYLDNNTGSLVIRTNVASDVGGDILIKPHDDEDGISIHHDGNVEIYYDGSKRLETTSSGIAVTGGITTTTNSTFDGNYQTFTGANYNAFWDKAGSFLKFNDNAKAVFGTGTDFEIWHSGSVGVIDNNTGALSIQTTSNLELEVQSNFRVLTKGGTENCIQGITDGAVELYYDNAKKFETTSAGVKASGNVDLDDSNKVRLGDAGDLSIWHDGSQSWITNSADNLYIKVADGKTDGKIRLLADDNANMIECNTGGNVELYYDGSKKLETTTNGVSISNGYLLRANYFLIADRSSNLTGYAGGSNFGTPMVFNRIVTEEIGSGGSSCFDTSTGLCTVPVTGTYWVQGSAYTAGTAVFQQAWFTVNGSRQSYTDWVNYGTSQFAQCNTTLRLSAGATIGFKPYGSGSSNTTISATANHTWFKVHLIG